MPEFVRLSLLYPESHNDHNRTSILAPNVSQRIVNTPIRTNKCGRALNDLPSVTQDRLSLYRLDIVVNLVPVMSDLEFALEVFQWIDYTAGMIQVHALSLFHLIDGLGQLRRPLLSCMIMVSDRLMHALHV